MNNQGGCLEWMVRVVGKSVQEGWLLSMVSEGGCLGWMVRVVGKGGW